MECFINKLGLTIKELKEVIKDLPEKDEYGEDYTVWLEHTEDSGLSSPVKSVIQLNKCDMIFTSRIF